MKSEIKSIQSLSESETSEINDFIMESNSFTNFESLVCYETIEKELQKDISLMIIREKNKICIILFLSLEKKGLLSYYYSPPRNSELLYASLIFSSNLSYEKVIDEIVISLKSYRKYYFNITLHPSFKLNNISEKALELERNKTSLIHVSKDIEDLWKELKSNCRRHIRNARKKEVSIEFAGNDQFDTFYQILSDTYSRSPVKIRSRGYLNSLIRNLGSGKSLLAFAKVNDEYVSGVCLLMNKDWAYYWLGASVRSFNKYSPGNLIQWNIIEYLNKNGFNYYDMMNLSIPQVAEYKTSFGGDIVPFLSIVKRPLISNILSRITDMFLQPNRR